MLFEQMKNQLDVALDAAWHDIPGPARKMRRQGRNLKVILDVDGQRVGDFGLVVMPFPICPLTWPFDQLIEQAQRSGERVLDIRESRLEPLRVEPARELGDPIGNVGVERRSRERQARCRT